jgi:hypothetical protein
MLRPASSMFLLALPLLAFAPHLIPGDEQRSAPGAGGNEPPVCAIEYQGQVVTQAQINVAITPPLTSIDLSSCSSFDPDGGPVTFEWQACPGATFSDPTACNTTLIVPTPAGSNFSCDVRCLVTDSTGVTAATNCRLFINFFENTPPTCVVNPTDITVYAEPNSNSATVTLDACASFDPDPDQTITFDWDGCPLATFSDEFACSTQMTIDLTGQTLPLSCAARVTVGDGVEESPFVCRVKITVLPPPDLDLCPTSCPTFVGLTQTGMLRSELVANATFDVAQVDTSTLRLQRADGTGSQVPLLGGAVGDFSTPVDAGTCDCTLFVPDGFADLTLVVDVPTLVTQLALFNDPIGGQVEIELVGELLDGTPFTAQDCVTINP